MLSNNFKAEGSHCKINIPTSETRYLLELTELYFECAPPPPPPHSNTRQTPNMLCQKHYAYFPSCAEPGSLSTEFENDTA